MNPTMSPIHLYAIYAIVMFPVVALVLCLAYDWTKRRRCRKKAG